MYIAPAPVSSTFETVFVLFFPRLSFEWKRSVNQTKKVINHKLNLKREIDVRFNVMQLMGSRESEPEISNAKGTTNKKVSISPRIYLSRPRDLNT